MHQHNQYGKTILEVISALVFFSLLSLASIFGIKYLLIKHKTNEFWNEMNFRSITLSSQSISGHNLNLNEYEKDVQGASIELLPVAENDTTFSLLISGVNQEICQEMLKNRPQECVGIQLKIDADYSAVYPLYATADTICANEIVDLKITYNNDLNAALIGSCQENSDCGEGKACISSVCQNEDCVGYSDICGDKETCDKETKKCIPKTCEEIKCPENKVCNENLECVCNVPGCQVLNSDCTCLTCNEITHVQIGSKCCEKIANCKENTYDSDCKCTACDDSYIKSENGIKCCPKMDHNCASYDDSCNCLSCVDPYVLNASGECVSCNSPATKQNGVCVCPEIENCASSPVNEENCKCLACNDPWKVNYSGNQCCQKIDNCEKYDDSCLCSKCDDSYTLTDGACVATTQEKKFACAMEGNSAFYGKHTAMSDSKCPEGYRWATASDLNLKGSDYGTSFIFENDLNPKYDDCKEQYVWLKDCWASGDQIVPCTDSLSDAWMLDSLGSFGMCDRNSSYCNCYALCILK